MRNAAKFITFAILITLIGVHLRPASAQTDTGTGLVQVIRITDDAKSQPASNTVPPANPAPSTPNVTSKTDTAPKLKILRPTEGETFDDTPIVFQIEVENFELRPPQPYFGQANPKPIGHLHVYLDNYPEIATSSTELMFGKKQAGHYLKKGQHTLAVELVHDNHDSLEPRIWQRVNFNFTH